MFFIKATNKKTGEIFYHCHNTGDGQHYLRSIGKATALSLESANALKASYEQSHVLGDLHTWEVVDASFN